MFAVKRFVVSCQLKKARKEVILLFYVVCVFSVDKSGQNTTGTPSKMQLLLYTETKRQRGFLSGSA